MTTPPASTKPVLAYLAGWGRSGSTLLGGLIGTGPDRLYLGETWNLWEDRFVKDANCSCRTPYQDCPFWIDALNAAGIDAAMGQRLHDIKFAWMGTRQVLLKPRAMRASLESGDLAVYAQRLDALYAALIAQHGPALMVDASKSPNLLPLLAGLNSVQTRIIHLVRDPRAVAYSWSHRAKARGPEAGDGHMARHSPARSTLSWLARNMATEHLAARTGLPILRVRYEDLVEQTEATLERIATFLDLDTEQAEQDVDGAQDHSVRGNPIRFQPGAREIRPDTEWRTAQPAGERRLVTLLARPRLTRYGYAP